MLNPFEQVDWWLHGISIHLGAKPEGTCCPDFSCCIPELAAPQEEREHYADLFFKQQSHRDIQGMRLMFLGRVLKHKGNHIPTHLQHIFHG